MPLRRTCLAGFEWRSVWVIVAWGLVAPLNIVAGDSGSPRAASNLVLPDWEKAERQIREGVRDANSQSLAFQRSLVGDYAGAIYAFDGVVNRGQGKPAAVAAEARAAWDGYRAVPAIDAIVEEARRRQIVILNEAHHVPRHRAFAQLLAIRLREIGFEYLACETFSPTTAAVAQRGYVTRPDGYYTREPIFADFVRQSLKLGFTPVAYERERTDLPPDSSTAAQINERETFQAAHLVERVLKKNPKAKLFVYVGFSHILKEERESRENGEKLQWMAGRLKAMSGIDPLTIDQVAMTEPPEDSLHGHLVGQIFSGDAARLESVVLRREPSPRYLVRDSYPNDADMQVYHRPATYVRGRPDWLAMQGYRTPREIPAELLPKSGRRLIKAMLEGERDDSIAVDQIVVTAGTPPPVLMLPAGRFRFLYEE